MDPWLWLGKIPAFLFLAFLYLRGRQKGLSWTDSNLLIAALLSGLCLGTAFLPSIIGALAGGFIIWLMVLQIRNIRTDLYFEWAIGLCLLLGIGRWGCFLDGCCFGKLTDLPWGVTYEAGSFAWQLHQAMGWIPSNASRSLAVHPYPIYESLGLFIWAIALWILRNKLKWQGALLLLTVCFDFALRSWIDCYRAMINIWWINQGSFLGLNLWQCALIGGAFIAFAFAMSGEFCVRNNSIRIASPLRIKQPISAWIIFPLLWSIAVYTNHQQTPFLHHLQILALVLCAVSLRLPQRQPFFKPLTAPLIGLIAISPLAISLGATDLDTLTPKTSDESILDSDKITRTWIYDVQKDSGTLVRVGNNQDPSNKIAAIRHEIHDSMTADKLWIQANYSGGYGSMTFNQGSNVSCGGPSQVITVDKSLHIQNASIQTQWDHALDPQSMFSFGSMLGYTSEIRNRKTTTSTYGSDLGDTTPTSSTFSQSNYSTQGSYIQLWGINTNQSINKPLDFGITAALVNWQYSHSDTFGNMPPKSSQWVLYPGFHFRIGRPYIGFEFGHVDPIHEITFAAYHFGFSGTISMSPKQVPTNQRWASDYFVGMSSFGLPQNIPDPTANISAGLPNDWGILSGFEVSKGSQFRFGLAFGLAPGDNLGQLSGHVGLGF